MSPSKRTGKAAASSCTHQAPSSKPGNSATLPASSKRSVPVGSNLAPSFAAQFGGVIGFHRDVERRLAQLPGDDIARFRLAPAIDQDGPEPGGRVGARGVDRGEHFLAVARHAAQHGVDQAAQLLQALDPPSRRPPHGRACPGTAIGPHPTATAIRPAWAGPPCPGIAPGSRRWCQGGAAPSPTASARSRDRAVPARAGSARRPSHPPACACLAARRRAIGRRQGVRRALIFMAAK